MPRRHTPSQGSKPDKIWRDAIHRAVKRVAEDGETKKLEQLADKLVAMALEGGEWALGEIGNRLDGRAPTTQDVNLSGDHTITHIADPISRTHAWLADVLREGRSSDSEESLPN